MKKAEPIHDRDALADLIAEEMHNHFPAWSIDTLLTHPHDAIRMAGAVLKRLGRKATEEAIAEICRAALANRKRGRLKHRFSQYRNQMVSHSWLQRSCTDRCRCRHGEGSCRKSNCQRFGL